MHPRRKFLTAIAATWLAAGAERAHADECAAAPNAASCYLSAAQAVRDRDPGEAAKLYLASYKLEPKIDPLAGAGISLAAASQYAAAAEVLEKAIEEYEKLEAQLQARDADATTTFAVVHRLQLARSELVKISTRIGWIQIDTPDRQLPSGVTVIRKGGGELRSSNPTKLVVNTGGDHLVFTFASGRTLELPVNVSGGVISKIAMPGEPVPAAPPPVVEQPEPVDPGARYQRYAYIAGGAGAGLLAIGIGHAVIADPTTLSAVLIGAGVLGLGAGAVLWYQAHEQRSTRTTALVPVLGDHMVGIGIAGRL